MYCNHGKKSIYSLIAEAVTMAVVSSQVRGHTLQPSPAEANGATTTTSGEVSLSEPQDTTVLPSCVGTLWFGTTWLGDSFSRDRSNENVPPHQKHVSECKRALMISVEQMRHQPPDSHTAKNCCTL